MPEMEKDCQILREKLKQYNKTKKKIFKSFSEITLEDIIVDNKVREIPSELLRDAAASPGEDAAREVRAIHRLARDILLLWARIFCGKVLLAQYRNSMNDDIREKIIYGVSLGTVKCFKSIREAVNRHFASEDADTPFLTRGKTVQDYMLICAANKVKTELGTYYRDCLTEISAEEAERKEMAGEKVHCKNGRYYVGKFLPLEIPDEDDDSSYCPGEVMEQITMDRSRCADEMLQTNDVKRLMNEVICHMRQNGILDIREWEFLSRSFGFRGEPERLADIERDWKKRGIKIEGGNLYNFRRSVLAKMLKTMREKPEWSELSFHAAA